MKITQVLVLLAVGGLGVATTFAAARGGGRAGNPPAGPNTTVSSLTRPATPTATPDEKGFLRRWLVLEPIRGSGLVTDSGVQAAAKKEYFPNQMTVVPHDGDKVAVDGAELTWHAVDALTYNVNLYHFAFYSGLQSSNAVFWAVTVVNSPEEMKDVRLAIGCNSGTVWWVNGQEVVGVYGDRQTVIDDGVSKRLTLHKGPNVVRVMVVNNGGWCDFCARFLDADDKPITGLSLTLESTAATSPASKSPVK